MTNIPCEHTISIKPLCIRNKVQGLRSFVKDRMLVSDKLVDGTKREFMKNVHHNPFDRNSND